MGKILDLAEIINSCSYLILWLKMEIILLGLKGENKGRWLLMHCNNRCDHVLAGMLTGQAVSW